jgi:phytanoyl-CoA hydroxylase
MTGDPQREHFMREGFIRVPGLVDARTIARLLDAAQALMRAGSALEHDTIVRGVAYQVQSATGRVGEAAVWPGALRKITFASKGNGAFARLRSDARVLGLIERLGVASPRCLVDQLNIKLPRVGTGFPFHQDAPFLVTATRALLERHGGANLVIALDPADAGNGGFEVLGRTHLAGLVPFDYDLASSNEGVFDESRRTLIPLLPGDAAFFHPHLAHGSGPNRSERPRRLVTLWFVGGGPGTPGTRPASTLSS